MRKFITGIDGLRTLGVLAVIFYHITPANIVGGYLGVLIFFVISGYFTADSLLREYEREGRINWKFYVVKRLKRLYPLLFTTFFATTLFFFFFQPKMLTGIRDSFLSSVFSVNNWWQIVNGSSYFSNFTQTANNAFKHLYFLSIEGQFYIVLAALFLIFPKKKGYGLSLTFLLILSFASAITMAFLFRPNDPTRVYYGTDTRLFAFLIGVALSVAFRQYKPQKKISMVNHIFSIPLTFSILIIIISAIVFLPSNSPIVYFGGMYGFSVLIAILIALIVHPALSINKYFSNPLFSYIGSRSYGIYLWQLPVFVSLENFGINITTWYNAVFALLLILGLSELSYRYVEKLFRRISWKSFKHFLTKNVISVQKIPFYLPLFLSIAAVVIILSAPVQAEDMTKLQRHISKAQKSTEKRNQELEAKAKEEAQNSNSSSNSSAQTSSSSSSDDASASQTPQDMSTLSIVAAGDSVLLDVAEEMQRIFPKIYIDGSVGRQASDGVSVLQSVSSPILDEAQLFLINLGVNGTISSADIAGIMQIANGRPVYWVNVRVPRIWQDKNNEELVAAEKQYHNLQVLDWFSASVNHPEYFVSDGVHLTTAGIAVYSNLIINSITNNSIAK